MNRQRFIAALTVAGLGAVGVTAAVAAIVRVRVGDMLTGTHGTWAGKPTRYTYAWQRHKTGTAPGYITVQDGANSQYLTLPKDVGYEIRVRVTAYNQAGSSKPASSLPTGTVHR